jgi:hypothetical protein
MDSVSYVCVASALLSAFFSSSVDHNAQLLILRHTVRSLFLFFSSLMYNVTRQINASIVSVWDLR